MIGDFEPHAAVGFVDLLVIAGMFVRRKIFSMGGSNVPRKLLRIAENFATFRWATKHPSVDGELRDGRDGGGRLVKGSDDMRAFQNRLEKIRVFFKIFMGLHVST